MTFPGYPGAGYNVAATFNQFFRVQLTAAGLPAWLSSAVVNYDFPQQPLTFPSFSVTHLGSDPREVAQGRHLDPGWKGVEQIGLADVRCWESVRGASGAHGRNLAQMRDMIARVFATGAATPILDVYGTTANPTGNGTIVRMGPAREVGQGPDPNADITSRRFIVQYSWLERVTAG